MLIKSLNNLMGMPGSLGLLVLALTASSCSHTEASPPPVSRTVVMQAIRDYGRGHQALLTAATSEKPDQPDLAYSAHIRNILVQEDFAQLETIAQQNRTEKGRLLGGGWKILGFYNGTSEPTNEGESKDSSGDLHIGTLKKWIAAYPNSTAARLSLAYLYVNYAWIARGNGFADSVSDTQWNLYSERIGRAKAILLEARSFKDKDPFWYQLMQLVAHSEGWDKAQARELFDQAVAFEPGYYHYYLEYSRYLLPEWYGKSGDIQTLAEEISSRVPEPDSSMFYFWIFTQYACYCPHSMEDLPHANYPKIRQGYKDITRLYGVSNLNANRFAYFATSFEDRTSAHDAFASVEKMEDWVWHDKRVFDACREWANSQENFPFPFVFTHHE